MTPEEVVERAAEVLAEAWPRMHTNESLGKQRMLAQALADAGLLGDLAAAWDEGSRAGWSDRTKSFMQARTYEQEVARATPNPYRQEVTS